MKIGIFDPYLDDLGGGEKYMMTIAQCLSQRHDVNIFWDNKSDLDPLLTRFSIDLSRVKVVANIFTSKVSTINRFLATRKYDALIILSDGSIPLVASRLYVHIQQPLSSTQATSFLGKIKLARINKVFCNSEYTKSFLNEKLAENSTVIYPPVSLKPKDMRKENIILHVGRFRVKDVRTIRSGVSEAVGDYKKQAVMIEAFKQMVDDGLKSWKFVLAVSVLEKDEEEFEKMKKSATGYPIEFLVNKTNDQLWDIYSKAKIYWHASGFGEDLLAHPEFAEHFGISTVEAMGAGVVPVVINAGGQKEIVTDSDNGFLWENLTELKDKTLDLIKNEKKLELFSNRAKKRAQKFTGDRFCRDINNLIV